MNVAKKQLSITLEGSKLEFDFEGPWGGKDVAIVRQHIGKQYALHVRSIRRKELARKRLLESKKEV